MAETSRDSKNERHLTPETSIKVMRCAGAWRAALARGALPAALARGAAPLRCTTAQCGCGETAEDLSYLDASCNPDVHGRLCLIYHSAAHSPNCPGSLDKAL